MPTRSFASIVWSILFALAAMLKLAPANGQTAVGSWRDHLPYSQAFLVTEGMNKVYCATGAGLFYFNKTDNSINRLTRIQGLSDFSVSALGFDQASGTLVIAYSNGNLDLLASNIITNISDIKAKANLINKRINNIYISGGLAYLSCGFGIVVLNIQKKEISDTYYIGDNGSQLETWDVCADDTYLYAATSAGVRQALRANPALFDYNAWTRISGLPDNQGKFIAVEAFAGDVFVIYQDPSRSNDKIYYSGGSSWNELNTGLNTGWYSSLTGSQGQLYVTALNNCLAFNSTLQKTREVYYGNPLDALADEEGNCWIADQYIGLVKVDAMGNNTYLKPNGPPSPQAFSLTALPGKMILLGGAVNSSWGNTYTNAEISIFENQQWKRINVDTMKDPIVTAVDPKNMNHVYIGSWGYGLLELLNEQPVKLYNETNSSLQTIIPNDKFVRVGGMAFDASGNLWVANSGVPNPISVRKADGSWKGLAYGSRLTTDLTLGKLIITQGNVKWIVLPRGNGLFAFDDNNTIDNINDDKFLKFGIVDQNVNTISNYVYSLAEDLDGNIWVGTGSGPVVYYNPGGVFTGDNFYATQVIIPRKDGSGLGDLLLSNETITAIAVDGANRKWFGTQNSGVFLMSADGITQVYHFNMVNSPLFSNTINDIAIDPQTGEVFIATSQGLISFRSTATAGNERFGKVYVYPDPVRPEYQGNIVITGLIRNTNVKITDVSGNLVFETTSLGGQAIWNGKNLDGRRAATGVYLVFCSSEDGTQNVVTKLLFIH